MVINRHSLPRRQVNGSLHVLSAHTERNQRDRDGVWADRMIASRLSVSENTVANHFRIIYGRLGINKRSPLVAMLSYMVNSTSVLSTWRWNLAVI